ncbi:VacJ family lipoprotein [Paracoccaceae bacterium]|nr:VacJ family lipoprotein [Paracoccaceae bacterium]
MRLLVCIKLFLVAILLSSAVCAQGFMAKEPYDPIEDINRKTHEFNKGLDKYAIRPTSSFYGSYVPELIRIPISNFRGNLNEPKRFFNHLLQRDLSGAGVDLSRFVINSTLGIGGLIDVASMWNIYPRSTGFDETFNSINIPQGAYVELPLFGPSSARGTVALITDYALNPSKPITEGIDGLVMLGVEVANVFQKRYEFAPMIDATLYNSADSYAATRNVFFQTKQEFNIDDQEADVFDPYSED